MSETIQSMEELPVPGSKKKYRVYSTYQDSGIEWLGNVPTDWKIKRLKYVVTCNDDVLSELTDDEYTIQYVDISSVDLVGGIQKTEELKYFEAPSRARRKVENGDTIISTVRTYLKSISFVDNPPSNLIVSTGFAVIRPTHQLDPKYLTYYLQSQGFVDAVVANSVGVSYPAINPSTLVTLAMLLPQTISEQQSIANFLDKKTAKIDELIEKKQRLIELLKEKRTALISHAVTKGLDPNAKMKDSGVEWLGKVPEGWKIKKLKYCTTKIGSGKTPKGGAEVYTSTGVALLRSQNIYDDGLRLSDVVFIDKETDLEMKNTRVELLDVLLNITGASIGRCALANKDCLPANVNQHVCIIRTTPYDLLPEFAHIFLCSKYFKDFILSEEQGTSREGLNFQQIGNISAPLPSTNIQENIINAVNIQTAQIDALIQKVQTAIDKLKEYRTALISAAVTGKIDVRGYNNNEGDTCQ